MKKVLSVLLLCVMAVALVGCGATPLTEGQVQLQSKAVDAQVACYERLQVNDARLALLLNKVPESQVGLVMVLQSMQEHNKALMSIATGNQYNPCSTGANAFDVQIAEVKSKNAAAASITGSAFNLGKWVVGGITLNAMADKFAGDTITATGGSEINQSSKNSNSVAGGNATSTNSSTSELSPDQSINSEDELIEGEEGLDGCPVGMELRESTGECITFEEKAQIEAAAAAEAVE